ncbi:MAG: zinc-dependent alcohol dehydrogenase family protein [Ignavibacteriales bacterium]|nr:zinc-dependent alcohol dehydrogenase family protein [Ignavibacteriales bacterium]
MMQALQINSTRQMAIVQTEIPVPDDASVLIKVSACGICGTDVHIFQGEALALLPLIPGHEFGGEVIFCGQKVKRFNTGDNVAIDPNIHCGYCSYCREGRINLCINLQAVGVTRQGGFAEYVAVPETQVYKLPPLMDVNQSVFIEPLSCCLHGMDIISVKPGDKVIISGAGAIGLYMLQLAKLAGASSVIVIESIPIRAEIAKKYGADAVLSYTDCQLQDTVMSLQNGGPDVLIECAGKAESLENLFRVATKGSRVLLFGLAAQQAAAHVKMQEFFHKELRLYSSLLNPFTFQRAIDLLHDGIISTGQFVIDELFLGQPEIERVLAGKQEVSTLKSIIKPHQKTTTGVTL